jgi:hypothetical protein
MATIKQDKTDNRLETSNKTIVGAVNETKKEIDTHIVSESNPHRVTWQQIINQGSTLATDVPRVAGTATAGTSILVAR